MCDADADWSVTIG